jgi:hypothetical protein
VAIIGIGIGVAIAVAIGFCRPLQPIATAIAISIPIPTDMVFSFLFEFAKCQPTYDLIIKAPRVLILDFFLASWSLCVLALGFGCGDAASSVSWLPALIEGYSRDIPGSVYFHGGCCIRNPRRRFLLDAAGALNL